MDRPPRPGLDPGTSDRVAIIRTKEPISMMWKFRSIHLLAAIGLGALPTATIAQQQQSVEADVKGNEAAPGTKSTRLSEEQSRLNLESFDLVWETIRDKHFDPDLNGADWPAIREELRPRVAEATSMDEARDAMREMIGRLEQSHFGIIPGSVYDAIDGDDGLERGDGRAGLPVR